MVLNYLKVTLRHLARNRIYSAINILGFALGLGTSLIITLYVLDDLSFDRMHDKRGRIYRILTEDLTPGSSAHHAVTSGMLVRTVQESIPEVENSVRLVDYSQSSLSIAEDGVFDPDAPTISCRALYGDSTFFDVFSFELLSGSGRDILRTPNTCLISDKVQATLFDGANPIGRQVSYGQTAPRTITGVYRAMPANSHLRADILLSPDTQAEVMATWNDWHTLATVGYLLLRKGADPDGVEAKMQQVALENNFGEGIFRPTLQPLKSIHLDSGNITYDRINHTPGDKTRVIILAAIATLTLLLASINFINLSSARAIKRAREVGLRKVVGAGRGQLAFQFLGESSLMALLAMILAIFAVWLMEPLLPQIFERSPIYTISGTPLLLPLLLITGVIVGLLSGVYPALVLASFQPITSLRGGYRTVKQKMTLRHVLVTGQFAISIALIVAVLVVLQQLRYLQTMNVGYNREQVLTIPMWSAGGPRAVQLLENELKSLPTLESVGGSSHLPSWELPKTDILPEGRNHNEKGLMVNQTYIDEGYLTTLQINITQGRNFSSQFAADAPYGVILNDAALRYIGWQDVSGRRLTIEESDREHEIYHVVGVVEDFQYSNPRSEIEPLIMHYDPRRLNIVLARIRPGMIPEAIDQIRATYNRLFPERRFVGYFLDDIFDAQFKSDRQFARDLSIFAGLAILIATLGLFGLASHSTEQRRKEIAIRKVLGSGERQVVTLLTWDMLRWVLLANLFAWPLGWFGLKRWLDDFVHRTPLTLDPFLLAALSALIVAALTVAVQSLRAARTNPADVLRNDA